MTDTGPSLTGCLSAGSLSSPLGGDQVMRNPGYAKAAEALSSALQAYSRDRTPYQRAADEIELAINTRHAQRQQRQRQRQRQQQTRHATGRQEEL